MIFRNSVFVSYASQDRQVAMTVVDALRGRKADVFFDEDGVCTGDDILEKLMEQVALKRELWIIVSKWSIEKYWVMLEIGAAYAQSKRVVPILSGIAASAVSNDVLKKLRMGAIEDLDKILDDYERRSDKDAKIFGDYEYKAYTFARGKKLRYAGKCTISPDQSLPNARISRYKFSGERLWTVQSGSEAATSARWSSKWAALFPDGKIRVEYRFHDSLSPEAPSFASLAFLAEEETLRGKFMVVDVEHPEEGSVVYTKT